LGAGLGKLKQLNDVCAEVGVHTQPQKVDGVWIVPILSWYHASFDQEPDIPGAPAIEKVSDFVMGSSSFLKDDFKRKVMDVFVKKKTHG
jgi:hypothetical protein